MLERDLRRIAQPLGNHVQGKATGPAPAAGAAAGASYFLISLPTSFQTLTSHPCKLLPTSSARCHVW